MMKKENLKHQIWEEAHTALKDSMQKEISVMRELLANMHQEEMSLVRHDKLAWDQIMLDRFLMIQRLSFFRNARMEATQKLEILASSEQKGEKITLEQILPANSETCCEIMFLLDQIMALMDKMNLQNTRNEVLFEKSQGVSELPTYLEYIDPIPKNIQNQKRKNSVATYPQNQ